MHRVCTEVPLDCGGTVFRRQALDHQVVPGAKWTERDRDVLLKDAPKDRDWKSHLKVQTEMMCTV